jgi:hypothetical protein
MYSNQASAGAAGAGPAVAGTQNFQTAAELRRQLHGIKARDREAAVFAAQAPPAQRFLKSQWFTALITSVAVFILLYITNPIFVHTVGPDGQKQVSPKPNLRYVTAWAVLAGLLVVLGPMLYQKFSKGATALSPP